MSIDVAVEGVHPTTVSCLEALQNLQGSRSFARALDMGCGSGVLSVMAVDWFGAQVLAADIAQAAVSDTQALAQARDMDSRITAIRSDGFSAPEITAAAPYDLIIFNLLAEPILACAPEVKAHLAPGGVVVLSGMLMWLSPEVERAYRELGFTRLAQLTREPWQTMVWELSA